jgi:hypothetical protein
MYPVELVDVFPTVLDLLHFSFSPRPHHSPRGKSLAAVVLGEGGPSEASTGASTGAHIAHRTVSSMHGDSFWTIIQPHLNTAAITPPAAPLYQPHQSHSSVWNLVSAGAILFSTAQQQSSRPAMPTLRHRAAISQAWMCTSQTLLDTVPHTNPQAMQQLPNPWKHCRHGDNSPVAQVSVMGYSLRTVNFRYTMWIYFNRETCALNVTSPPYAEEFYDHSHDTSSSSQHSPYAAESSNSIDVLEKSYLDILRTGMYKYLQSKNVISHILCPM